VFSGLDRLKFLRGSVFDPFGYRAERRAERELIGWFETILDSCAERATPDTAVEWCAILSAPMEIRGFGPVKTKAIAKVCATVSDIVRDA